MLSTWREQFSLKNITLLSNEPEKFVICQWQHKSGPSIKYLVYRWFIAIYFVTTWLASIIFVKEKTDWYQLKWVIYLTNWTYTICTFQAFLVALIFTAFILTYRIKNYGSVTQNRVLRCYKLYWATNTIAVVAACSISIIYWCFVYDPKKNDMDVMNIILHGMNTIVMTIDFWMVSHPFRIAHCIYPMSFVAIYGVFSWSYYVAGGISREGTTYIYSILNWGRPHIALITCVCVAILFFLTQSVYVFMHWLKKRVHKRIYRINSIELTTIGNEGKGSDGYINQGVFVGDHA